MSIGWLPLTIFLVAVTILAGLQLFFDRTMFGRAMRATSDDHEAAQLMAINDRHVYAIAMGIALAIAGIAGVFVGVRTTFSPLDGSVLLIFAFEAVIIGGLGSLWGTLGGRRDPRRVADARGARVAELVPALGSPGVPRGAGRPADRTVRATRERDVSRSVSVRHSTAASRWGSAAGAVVVLVLALAPVFFVDSALRTLLQFFYLLALAEMWNLLAGFAGLVSIGQQAYIGIGAYSLLVFADHLGANFFLSIFLAAIVAGVLAIPTAALVFRLRGGYFSIGTWVVAEVYLLLIANTQSLGGGSGATITSAIGIDPTTRLYVTYWIALGVAVASVLGVYALIRTRLGLALRAVRDHEDAAPTLGINVQRAKVQVYVLASAACGLIGAVIYANLLRLQPVATFSVNWSAFMIFAVVIGGIGTITGPIVGTLIYFSLQQYLADLGPTYLIILGAVAVLVMVKAPKGLWGLVLDRWDLRFFPVEIRVRTVDTAPTAAERSTNP